MLGLGKVGAMVERVGLEGWPHMSCTGSIPAASRPALWSLHAATSAGLSSDASDTITATGGAPTSLLQT